MLYAGRKNSEVVKPEEEELEKFCERLAEMPRNQQRRALVEYFQPVLNSMTIAELN